MSNLDGTVFAVFQDGAIRGLNVAQMIRSLTSGTLSGWQEGQEQTTDLTQLSRLVPDREGPGHHHRSQSGRPAGEDDRRRHHRPRHQDAGVPGRAEAGDDHRRPGPRRRSGRARHSRHHRRPVGRAADLSRDGRHSRQSRMRPMPSSRRWARACSAPTAAAWAGSADWAARSAAPDPAAAAANRHRRPARPAPSESVQQGLGQSRNIPPRDLAGDHAADRGGSAAAARQSDPPAGDPGQSANERRAAAAVQSLDHRPMAVATLLPARPAN